MTSKMWAILVALAALTVVGDAELQNSTNVNDVCDLAPWEQGPWGAMLEQWAVSAPPPQLSREGRILALPPANGYYVTDRMGTLPQASPVAVGVPQRVLKTGNLPHPRPYDEWRPPTHQQPGKILNKPPHYDNFKPSFGVAPLQTSSPAADRVDAPQTQPPRQVSETDLYLLGAIEKLTYRLDLMEKRLRKAEESLHHVLLGSDPSPEPCAEKFLRVGAGCYHMSAAATDWKAASVACRRLRAHLLELDSAAERRALTAALQTDKRNKDYDWWTGGLNPGLLWIWTHSARPVGGNGTANSSASPESGGGSSTPSIAGDGRCLALAFEPALRTHVYRGMDCGARHRYICELPENQLRVANEIEKVARELTWPSTNTTTANLVDPLKI